LGTGKNESGGPERRDAVVGWRWQKKGAGEKNLKAPKEGGEKKKNEKKIHKPTYRRGLIKGGLPD